MRKKLTYKKSATHTMSLNLLITTITLILGLCILFTYLSDPPIFIFRIICFILFIFFQIFFILRIIKKTNNEISALNKEHNCSQNTDEHTNNKATRKSFAFLDSFLKFLIIIIIFSFVIHLSLQCRLNEKTRARRINNPLFNNLDIDKDHK